MKMTHNMKKAILFLCMFLCHFILFAQTKNLKIIPQFQFEQIDSLTDNTLASISKQYNSSLLIANTAWYVGSYCEPKDNFVSYRNHFEIYCMFFINKKLFVQKIDNFGFFKKRRVKGRKIRDFIENFYQEMKNEQLTEKVDSSYNNEGKLITLTTVTDHELIYYIRILRNNDAMQYKFPVSYAANKANLLTHRYNFLHVLDIAVAQYNKKHPKRLFVLQSPGYIEQ